MYLRSLFILLENLKFTILKFTISCDIPSMRNKANTMDQMVCIFKYQLYDNTTDLIGFYTVYSIDSYMQFNRCLFIKQGQNIRFPEQSKNTERKKRKSFFLSLCKKVQLVSVLSFSFKMLFQCVKKIFVQMQVTFYCRTACVFITFKCILFVNIVHVCVICLTQTSMHQSNIYYTMY